MQAFFFGKDGIISGSMRLKHIEIAGFKSFAKKAMLSFDTSVTAVVGPNGSGKSNVVEAFRFVMGEQSMKSMRGKSGADLIFRGAGSKLSRAAVSITFDNSDKIFAFQTGEEKSPVLFDTVTFTREIFADGTSKYSLNGTEIRLKQMVELLSSVNIGTSSHHIISQGEADGILRANTRERREILEEALGLKVYHFRIKESESKLARATETLKEVQSLRRELAPHLKFLQKQVEKIEKAREIRTQLEDALVRYLATERTTLVSEESRITEAHTFILTKKKSLEETIATLPSDTTSADTTAKDIGAVKVHLAGIRDSRRSIEQKINRLEGQIEAHRAILAQARTYSDAAVAIPAEEYHQLIADLEFLMTAIREAQSVQAVQEVIARAEPILVRLKSHENRDEESTQTHTLDLKDLALAIEDLQRDLTKLVADEEASQNKLVTLEQEREMTMARVQESTRERYEVQSELAQCDAELQILAISKNAFVERKGYFDAELKEAAFMFGPTFLHTLQKAEVVPELDLHSAKRDIDRLKIRLDEHAGIGNDVVDEFSATQERDVFLARESADTEASIRNLESLIIELKRVLDERFTTGVKTINERFGEFFKTMFGGGSAFLSVTAEKRRKRKTEEDEDMELEDENDERFMERGIDVHVNLPEKKVKELQMLSGGERSLVSIALLFAISQVNPPPFLVLDETDAALDEANSRRYGDMIEVLAEYSQLIVVTHNRETMSRASVLYGVTIGADGGSKLLSIKFDDAVKVAK